MNLLVVDVANIYCRSASKLGHLKTSDGRTSGGLFGFIRSVRSMEKAVEPTDTYLAFECGGAAWRRSIDPAYKGDRLQKEDWYVPEHIEAINEWCDLSGRFPVHAEGAEADDVIAWTVRERKDDVLATVMSTDHDFRQLLDPDVILRHSASEPAYTFEKFCAEFGFVPERYAEYLALSGDGTDSVEGTFSPNLAKATVKAYHAWEEILLLPQMTDGDREQAERNLRLVSFREDIVPVKRVPDKELLDRYTTLRAFYESWEFASLIKELDAA